MSQPHFFNFFSYFALLLILKIMLLFKKINGLLCSFFFIGQTKYLNELEEQTQ